MTREEMAAHARKDVAGWGPISQERMAKIGALVRPTVTALNPSNSNVKAVSPRVRTRRAA